MKRAVNRETITVDVPHKLTKAVARKRIDEGFLRVQREIAGKSVQFEQDWQDDTMAFKGGAMGQTVSGRLTVFDDSVKIEIDLPWLLARMAGTIREKLSRGTTKLLTKE